LQFPEILSDILADLADIFADLADILADFADILFRILLILQVLQILRMAGLDLITCVYQQLRSVN
jgi:hypothetical protein